MRKHLIGSIVGVASALVLGLAMLPIRSHISVSTAALVLVIPVVFGSVIGGIRAGVASVIAGFTILQVKSLEEAIEWVKRAPNCSPGVDSEVEIRQVFEMEDFAPILSDEQIQHKIAKRAELPNQTANK